mmetsp:Transcript_26782/g.52570  ORF Transcript_26782/g.52570 Transcript_26782/m.52570 type:complete len:115 (-) Transcript_26782:2170-2514(-)
MGRRRRGDGLSDPSSSFRLQAKQRKTRKAAESSHFSYYFCIQFMCVCRLIHAHACRERGGDASCALPSLSDGLSRRSIFANIMEEKKQTRTKACTNYDEKERESKKERRAEKDK